MGVALHPHPGRGQQDCDQECAAAEPQGEVLPDEDDDAQVGTDNNISCCVTLLYYLFRYLSKNKHVRHIQHYVATCSIGDWFVLYQMSKNMNKRFFAEFLALLSLKVTKYIYLLLLLI